MSAGNGTATFANAAYTYDAMGRIATVGNSADTLTYSYVPGTNMIGSATWQEASINTVNTYDQYKRLTNIAVNNTSVYGYTLNDKNQRTGATLPDGRTWSYSYDTLGQLTGAVKRDSANTQLADLSYLYDQIGNRTSATENNTTTTYTSNLVNQYTQIASQVPTYDADGNMTSYNGWTYTWNGENRLVAAENSDTRLEFSYDYMGRRLEKKVYSKGLLTLYDWSLEKHRKFVYDGYKLIAEFEVEDDNATLFASYLWQPTGLDVPLMRIADNTQTYYIADGNKNIIALKDSSGADVSTYAYTPFGSLENPADGDENPFRFSSEYADDETGLVYYNYRYYSPQLGRWIKRDPIEEEGGVNLYGMIDNNINNSADEHGKFSVSLSGSNRLLHKSINASNTVYIDLNGKKIKLVTITITDIYLDSSLHKSIHISTANNNIINKTIEKANGKIPTIKVSTIRQPGYLGWGYRYNMKPERKPCCNRPVMRQFRPDGSLDWEYKAYNAVDYPGSIWTKSISSFPISDNRDYICEFECNERIVARYLVNLRMSSDKNRKTVHGSIHITWTR